MNYTINKDLKFKSKNPKIDIKLDNGYILPSRKGEFKINDTIINDITIINKVIISAFITNLVLKKFNKLIKRITNEIIDDDEGDSGSHLALNEIERFRVEIKNKYRKELDKKTLEMMGKKLKYFIYKIKENENEKIKENVNSKGRSR